MFPNGLFASDFPSKIPYESWSTYGTCALSIIHLILFDLTIPIRHVYTNHEDPRYVIFTSLLFFPPYEIPK